MYCSEKRIRESLDNLATLLRIPAFSGQEQQKADLFESLLREQGFSPERYGNNVVLRHEVATGQPWVWLLSHLDTVKPASSWNGDPFQAHWKNRRLCALGSNDAGASLLSLLEAYRHMTGVNTSANWIFIAAAEEENSGPGGITSLLPVLPPADLVLVGEPTGMKAAVAEKGLLVLDGVVSGKAGHAARNEGENAVYKALDDICWFRDYRFPRVSPYLGEIHMNLTVMHAGEKHNTVPDVCRYTVDIRVTDAYIHEEILEEVKQHVVADIRPRSMRLRPSATPADHRVLEALKNLDIPVYGSPTLSDQALLPYASLKIGPGDSARSHTADEFIDETEIREGIETYIALLLNTYGK